MPLPLTEAQPYAPGVERAPALLGQVRSLVEESGDVTGSSSEAAAYRARAKTASARAQTGAESPAQVGRSRIHRSATAVS
jgi:hypothetical protein